MKKWNLWKYLCFLFLAALCSILLKEQVFEQSRKQIDLDGLSQNQEFRSQNYGESCIKFLEDMDAEIVYKYAMAYLLETDYGNSRFSLKLNENNLVKTDKKWKTIRNYDELEEVFHKIWGDVKYFPIPKSLCEHRNMEFADSWMEERTYGGKRGHEGTDIFPPENIRGKYPVISITNGKVQNMGWLPKGGYRVGIAAPGGAYFYYAHLERYGEIQEGDSVKAGDIIGYMGDTGYGEEGTRGKFPVHLHIGIYLHDQNQTEYSINPYWILRYLTNHKLICADF